MTKLLVRYFLGCMLAAGAVIALSTNCDPQPESTYDGNSNR